MLALSGLAMVLVLLSDPRVVARVETGASAIATGTATRLSVLTETADLVPVAAARPSGRATRAKVRVRRAGVLAEEAGLLLVNPFAPQPEATR